MGEDAPTEITELKLREAKKKDYKRHLLYVLHQNTFLFFFCYETFMFDSSNTTSCFNSSRNATKFNRNTDCMQMIRWKTKHFRLLDRVDVWQDSQWFNNICGLFFLVCSWCLTTFQWANVKCRRRDLTTW